MFARRRSRGRYSGEFHGALFGGRSTEGDSGPEGGFIASPSLERPLFGPQTLCLIPDRMLTR